MPLSDEELWRSYSPSGSIMPKQLTHLRTVEAAVRADMAPRVVSTVEELDALPNDSVILDLMGDVGVVHGEHVWYPETTPIRRSKVAAHYLPATVLWVPVTPGGETNE